MIEEVECIHGLGPVTACVICSGKEKAEREARRTIVRTMGALYDGHCHVCGVWWKEGDSIAKTKSDEYIHEGCGRRAAT